MWILTCDDAGPARRTNGICAERVVKSHSLGSKGIDGRSRIEIFEHCGVGPHRLSGVIVRHDKKDVRPLGGSPAEKGGEGENRKGQDTLIHESFLDRK